MVPVGLAYCIDKYECSRSDATAQDAGRNDSIALSRPGVLPWMVNPMSSTHLSEFESACVAAGKHLCTREEWFAACSGTQQTTYVYGNTFDREACNCVDTFCDDYCAEHTIDSAQCRMTSDCGYTYNCYHPVPTAQFGNCTNDYGTLDMNGNVWEIVKSTEDARGYEVRGGAFNCASAAQRVNCSFNANWLELYAGFRCCKTIGH
jgi:formylglycine-generating enzyme required for sulfatase activity